MDWGKFPGWDWVKFPGEVECSHLQQGHGCCGEDAWEEYGHDKMAFVTAAAMMIRGIHADADKIIDLYNHDRELAKLYGMKAHGGPGPVGESGGGGTWRMIPREAFNRLLREVGRLKDAARFGEFYYEFLTAWRCSDKGGNSVADFVFEWRAGRKVGRPRKDAAGAGAGVNSENTPPESGRVFLQNEERRMKRGASDPETRNPAHAGAGAGATVGGDGGGVSVSDSGLQQSDFWKGGTGRKSAEDGEAWERARRVIASDLGAKEGIRGCDAKLQPYCAALFCVEENRAWALNTYRKAQRQLGKRLFEDELCGFVGDNDGVEVPGAAFVARLEAAGAVFGKGKGKG